MEKASVRLANRRWYCPVAVGGPLRAYGRRCVGGRRPTGSSLACSRDCSHASSASLIGGVIRSKGATMSTEPTHAHELNQLLRLRRMMQGIEGTPLLLCDHQLAEANGRASLL